MTASLTLLFRVGDAVYGYDIAETQEIIPLRPTTRLPGAPSYVRGLINMRGTIVTVLDLGQRLDPSRAPIVDGSIVLVRHGERLVGVVVEEVADVRWLDIDESAGSKAMGGSANGTIVRGVATVTDGAGSESGATDAAGTTVIVLDLGVVINQVLLS